MFSKLLSFLKLIIFEDWIDFFSIFWSTYISILISYIFYYYFFENIVGKQKKIYKIYLIKIFYVKYYINIKSIEMLNWSDMNKYREEKN